MHAPAQTDTLTFPPADLVRGFAGLASTRRLVIAVSGGPDSMALMHLATRWAATSAAPPHLHVATVDHGLRTESRSEADMVAATAAALGLPHVRLDWSGPKPATRLQERARAARYALLAAHAGDVGATHVLTAHHADDQAETVLLRLGRGSGIGGLAGMRVASPLAPGVTLVRPLLDVAKTDLIAFCRAEGIAFVDDPSNHNETFARARLRGKTSELAALGLDTPGLVRLARRMARADAALEAEAERVAAALGLGAGPPVLDLVAARDLAPEIALRVLRRAVAAAAPEAKIRLERLEGLAEALWAALAAGRPHRATLAGTRVTLDGTGRLTLLPETARRRGREPPRRD